MKIPRKPFLALLLAQVYDGLLTWYFVGNGLALEANPLMAWAMAQIGVAEALIVGKTSALIVAAVVVKAVRDEPGRWLEVEGPKLLSYTLYALALFTFLAGSYGLTTFL